MAGKSRSADQKKKLMLASLGLVLALVVAYQFLFSGSPPAKRPTAANSNQAARPTRTAPIQTARQAETAARQQATAEQPAETLPLDLAMLKDAPESAKVGPRGNIFAYYVPPPPPPVVQKPPPITLQFAQPQGVVAGTPRPFTLTVSGRDFPADAQILLDGNPKPTARVGNALTTEVTPQEYASPRSMNVEVKSQSDPVKFYSNPITFVVQPAPEPPFKYVGRIGDQGVFEMNAGQEVVKARPGGTIQNAWRVDAVTDAAAELTHVQYDTKRRLAMQDKGR